MGRATKKPRIEAEDTEAEDAYPQERLQLALELIQACKINAQSDIDACLAKEADAWVQDDAGWTALHYAAESNSAELCTKLLEKGAIWNITDHTGYTAGDVAFSLNHKEAYAVILNEGVRSEILKSLLATRAGEAADNEDGRPDLQGSAANNEVYLKTRLKFVGEGDQQVCLDEDNNAVMMGWERPIMQQTALLLCENHPQLSEGLEVVNIGFGLGIVDSALQTFKPKRHVIVEAHADVLAHMRKEGWYDKPGVAIFEGRWQDWLEAGMIDESGSEATTGGLFDVIYWDTFSEHYRDLYKFFDALPNLMRDETSRFSFFHGLGATSRLFWDVYTSVSEYHMRDIGLSVEWHDMPVGHTLGEVTWHGITRKYWSMPSYRCPIARLGL